MRLIIMTFLLFGTLSAWGQTKEELVEIKKATNVKKLTELADQYARKFKAERDRLERMQSILKLPTIVRNPDGSISQLMGLTEDFKPIYFTALDKNAVITARANYLYSGGGLGLSVHGESMTAGVWDVGRVYDMHEIFEGRVLRKDSAVYNTYDDLYRRHPTIVTGILIGSNVPEEGKLSGVAFKANAHTYDWGNDLSEMASAAEGLLVSNHSYGDVSYQSRYSGKAVELDGIAMNAPYYLSVWSCGNSTEAVGKITDESAAKNIMAVGNTDPVLNYTGPSSVAIGKYSSPGPTDDFRIKPDICVMGSRRWPREVIDGESTYNEEGVVNSYTSYAAPAVTGTLLLLQQHHNNVAGRFMRASTLKGLALHTADECGSYPGPDITFGWGLINAKKAAEAISDNGGRAFIAEDTLVTSGSYSREFIASGNEPLVATICWTDPPGAAVSDNNTTPRLINDLDARLAASGITYTPWKLDTANVTGAALQGDNRRDNVEKIEISSPAAGQVYTLTVNHKGTLVNNGQSFSIIVTGLKDCVENRTITSTVNSWSTDYQQASSTISANNVISDSAEVIYHAADQVLLTNGFTSSLGSAFRGYIEGCTNDYTLRNGAKERPVVTYLNTAEAEKETELADYALFPNPGNGLFTIDTRKLGASDIRILDVTGRAVYQRKFTGGDRHEIDIRKEVPGVYLLKIYADNGVYTKRISKN